MIRNLDGCYFRVKREGKWQNICFSDLTKDERDEVTNGKKPRVAKVIMQSSRRPAYIDWRAVRYCRGLRLAVVI